MLELSNRRFTLRLGRPGKLLKTGEQLNRRTSIVGRKSNARRVSVRNSAVLRRAPSAAGGVHRGASVRRSQSGVRRGASVKRTPGTARRNSRRISTLIVESSPQPSPLQTAPNDGSLPSMTGVASPPIMSPTSPMSPGSSKSFFSKLTSRFRGRSKAPKQPEPPLPLPVPTSPLNGITATLAASNLAPTPAPQRSPSLRSPSPGSHVTFADASIRPVKDFDRPIESKLDAGPTDERPIVEEVSVQPNRVSSPVAIEAVEESEDGEWVDAEDDEMTSEPHVAMDPKLGTPAEACQARHHSDPSGSPGVLAEGLLMDGQAASFEQCTEDQPAGIVPTVQLQAGILNTLSYDEAGSRLSQWLAITPAVAGEVRGDGDERLGQVSIEPDGTRGVSTSTTPKRESKLRQRPPSIVVPVFASNNPYRVPLPPSPLPGTASPVLSENNSYRTRESDDSGLLAEPITRDELAPPASPSILLTPAPQFAAFGGPELTRKSSDGLTVDGSQIPLPPSPVPSNKSALPEDDELLASPPAGGSTMARASSISTLGGRSLSTAPSTAGPATPRSMRFPGHPDLAHFTFGGPKSPSLQVEDWEESEEGRGRSLEVSDSKRRMRSKSPKLDSVLEGDENRQSLQASMEDVERSAVGSNETPAPSLLLAVEEDVAFGKKTVDDDSDSEHEDESGFYAFAERQLVEDKKAEAARLDVPKRSKTLSFLSGGFGKRKNTVGDVPPSPTGFNSAPRSSTSPRLLGVPAAGPKRSSTLMTPSGSDRTSRFMPGRSSTLMVDPPNQREALSPTMYTAGDIQAATGEIEDEESRRLSEAAFMF